MGNGDDQPRYEIFQAAYIKLVLHALKHRTSPVNGVLLGRPSSSDGSLTEIVDAVPLFHLHLGLLPNLEISLILIEEYYGGKGLNVVGYFHANERYDDSELGGVARNVGDHIYRYFPNAAILLLDNKKFEALEKGKDLSPVMQVEVSGSLGAALDSGTLALMILYSYHFIRFNDIEASGPFDMLYTRDTSKSWKLSLDGRSRLILKEPSANVVLMDYISSEKGQDIVDFDDHLDDISKDWLNPDLFK